MPWFNEASATEYLRDSVRLRTGITGACNGRGFGFGKINEVSECGREEVLGIGVIRGVGLRGFAKMSTAQQLISATMNDDKIVLKFPFDSIVIEWVKSLADARWDKFLRVWTVAATPATAWRVVNESPVHCEADDGVLELSRQWITSHNDDGSQPVIRIKDSWEHQRTAYHFALARRSVLLAMAMGTGKSKVAIDVVINRRCEKILIVCPVSVRGVWRREIEKHSAIVINQLVLEAGTVRAKAKHAAMFVAGCSVRNEPCAVIVNYESAKGETFVEWASSIRWDAVICDESHRIKGRNSQASKAMAKIGRLAKQRICLTGTPMPHSPLDLFGQFRFLDRGLFGTSYHRFRNLFAVSGHFGANHIVGFKNQEELAQLMRLITYEVDSSVLTLPESQSIDVPVALEPATRKAYEQMAEYFVAEIEKGVVTAANGLVKLLRLQQMTGGVLTDGDAIHEVIGHEKEDTLADLITDIDIREPVVVFCCFHHELDAVARVAEKTGREYGEISGRRKDLTPHSTMPEDVLLMGVQIQSGGVGIDLTRACKAVYWSTGFSLGNYEQSLARIHRPGQKRPVLYYHLIAERTVDGVVYTSLQKKRAVVDEVLSYLKGNDNGRRA